jgi:multiple sugar transport system substrate-binding protein
MKKVVKSVLVTFLAVALVLNTAVLSFASTKAAKNQVTLNALFMKQAGYSQQDVEAITNAFMKANPNIKVNLTFVAYEELEPKILAAASSGGYDVVLGDCIWPAQFAQAGLVKDVTSRVQKLDLNNIFKGAIDSITYKGKYYGIPWLNDVKYMFYNKKMLAKAGFKNPPKTWDELMAQAKVMKQKGIVQYPVASSWSQAECLICDYTAISGSFGGQFVDAKGNPTLDAKANGTALDFMANSIKQGITNPKSLEMIEDDVLSTFVSGNAAFALNWTYMYNQAQNPKTSKVVGDVGITTIPGTASAKSATVNGGMPLMMTSGTKNPEEAWNYMVYLSSQAVQKKYSVSALPIWKSLYSDPVVVKTSPAVVSVAQTQYKYLINRPQVPYYSALSTVMQSEIQKVLLGKETSSEALKNLQSKAKELQEQ